MCVSSSVEFLVISLGLLLVPILQVDLSLYTFYNEYTDSLPCFVQELECHRGRPPRTLITITGVSGERVVSLCVGVTKDSYP